MKIARQHLAETITKLSLSRSSSKKLSREIAAYLLTEHRTSELSSLLRDITQLRINHGTVEATLVSAHQISPRLLRDARQILHKIYPDAKTINIDTRQEPDVIGGVRIDLPNQQLDMTVARKLAIFKRLTSGDRA